MMKSMPRRTLLGAAGALVAMPAFADVISSAKMTASGGMVGGAATRKKPPYRIGFSNGFSGNTWRTEMLASLHNEANRHPEIKQLIVIDGQGSITKQVHDIQNLAAQEVDAILCIANSGTAVAPALRTATHEGIVTVPFNLPVSGTEWTAYTGTDPSNKGYVLAKWLRGVLNGEGKIIALGGIPGNSYTAAAWAGAKKAFAGSKIEVLAFKDAFWEEDKAKVVTADLLAAYPEIDGIWADGAQDGAGAELALLAAHRPLVPVTGDDYNGLLKLYARYHASEPKFDIAELSEPTWESVVALRLALKLLRGEQVPKETIITPQLITSANYQQYIRADLPDGVYVDTNLTQAQLKTLFG
ncbi:MAG TPA: substrate-binding domain-containing protein [Acetobacteraceae bacterium]|nr:substrate-binding domain-containing protein [Acetobacteraceae bacterium]